jgi:protein TonB
MKEMKSLAICFTLALGIHGFLYYTPFSQDSTHHFSHVHKDIISISARLSIVVDEVKIQAKPLKSFLKNKTKRKAKNKRKKLAEKLDNHKNEMSDTGDKSFFALYITHVRELVAKNKSYPFIARKLRQEGTVKLKIIILKTGVITRYELIQSSKFESLNKSTLNLVKRIGKFKPFPKKLMSERIEVTIPVIYELL